MLPTLLSIFLDYRCNFSCGHCSVGSSPSVRMKMPDEMFEKLFDDLATCNSLKVAVFTGGEPTLHLDMLKRGLGRARALGLRTRVVSNAWWAKTPEVAEHYLRDLKDAGLDEINSSYDDFHEPFIRLERIGHLAEAAMNLGMILGLGVINDRHAVYTTSSIKEYLSDRFQKPWADLASRIVMVEDYPTPSGTGEDLDVDGLSAGSKLNLGCPEIMKTISIHPNGSVKGCCGHGQLYQKDLAIGNIMDEKLEHILERSTDNIFYWWLHFAGPSNILKKLGVKSDHSSICHACNDLLGNHRDKLITYLHENRDEIFQNDVLMSDHFIKTIEWVSEQEEVVVSKFNNFTKDRNPEAVT